MEDPGHRLIKRLTPEEALYTFESFYLTWVETKSGSQDNEYSLTRLAEVASRAAEADPRLVHARLENVTNGSVLTSSPHRFDVISAEFDLAFRSARRGGAAPGMA